MKKIKVNKIAHLIGHKGGVFSLAQSYPNNLFLSGAGDGWIVEWDLTKPKDGALIALAEDTQTGGKASVFSLLRYTSPKEGGGEWYVAGNMNGGLHWIFPRDKRLNKDILHHKKGVFDIQYFNKEIYTTGGAGILSKWSLDTQRAIESIQLSGESLRRMTFSKKRNEFEEGAQRFFISEMLKEARSEANLTQSELAEKIGTKKSYISRIENGKGNITIETLIKIFETGLQRKVGITIS